MSNLLISAYPFINGVVSKVLFVGLTAWIFYIYYKKPQHAEKTLRRSSFIILIYSFLLLLISIFAYHYTLNMSEIGRALLKTGRLWAIISSYALSFLIGLIISAVASIFFFRLRNSRVIVETDWAAVLFASLSILLSQLLISFEIVLNPRTTFLYYTVEVFGLIFITFIFGVLGILLTKKHRFVLTPAVLWAAITLFWLGPNLIPKLLK